MSFLGAVHAKLAFVNNVYPGEGLASSEWLEAEGNLFIGFSVTNQFFYRTPWFRLNAFGTKLLLSYFCLPEVSD